MKKEKIAVISLLGFSILFFLSFGLFHLSKFETVDEHFWKFERIPQYWDAIKSREWKKTYVNDKPGISVALISGSGLLFESHPENARIRNPKITQDSLITKYDPKKIEKENFALRFPILLFNGLFLLYFFWIIRKITASDWIAVFSVSFMAISPALVGVSQIINPDSLLWTFSAASIFSYFALLETEEKKFTALTAFFTGMSLLSKYSANILFPFYLFILFSQYFIYFEKYKEQTKEYFSRNILRLLAIFLGSAIVFSIFLPAVFVKVKYLYRGTIGAPGFSLIAWPMLFIILLIALDTYVLKNYFLKKIGSWLFQNQQRIFKISISLISLIFIAVILNTWTGQKAIPFDKLGEDIYRNGKEIFDGILLQDSAPIKFSKELLLQFYPFVFSQLPFLLAIIIFFWIKTVFGKLERFKNIIFFCSVVPIIYFSALIFSNVLSNIRYGIMLYPIFSLLGGIAVYETISKIKEKRIKIYAGSMIIILGTFSLWLAKPFYLYYSNFLLPEKFLITDSWGYGEYEAAQFLNSLPNPEKILVWTDRTGVCQFLKGGCLTSRKIDLDQIRPDYFVFSKRGSVRTQFVWKYPELAAKSSQHYYEKNPVWQIGLNGKSREFVKVVKFEE